MGDYYEDDPMATALEEQWREAPGTTAANLIAAVVESRVNAVVAEHVVPQLEQQNADRHERNAQEAADALFKAYPEAQQFRTELAAALESDPSFVATTLDDAQKTAERFEMLWLQQRKHLLGNREGAEFAAIKAASSSPYTDAMFRSDAGARS